MKMQRFICFLILLGITACGPRDLYPDPNGAEKQSLANEVRCRVAKHLKKKLNLHPAGTMGQMLHDIEKLGLSFYYYQTVDIAQGRKLLVQAVNEMLDEINQKEQIHPFLCRYPFLPRNIEITIFLMNPDGYDVPKGSLYVIDAIDGYLRYEIDHPTKNGYITVYKETFDEALERIADPSLPLVAFEPDPEISKTEFSRLRQGIRFVSDDGAIWHLDNKGSWVKK